MVKIKDTWECISHYATTMSLEKRIDALESKLFDQELEIYKEILAILKGTPTITKVDTVKDLLKTRINRINNSL